MFKFFHLSTLVVLFGLPLTAMASLQKADRFLEQLEVLYDKYGNEKYMLDEDITQKAHVLQAAFMAYIAKAPDDVVIGMLFHDVGQITSTKHVGQTEYLHKHHDDIGAEWLKARKFPPFVRDFVRYHTIAKVFLSESNDTYFNSLSRASKDSYYIQKAKLNSPGYKKNKDYIETHFRLEDIKYARYFDDLAKFPELTADKLPGFSFYRKTLARVLQNVDGTCQDDGKEWVRTVEIWTSLARIRPGIFLQQMENLSFIHRKSS